MPHAAARIWALFQDYDRWTDYAPMVRRVEVIYPGDEHHNGRLRRVIFKMPFGREGTALELVTDVEPDRGYTYTMISNAPATTRSATSGSSRSAPNRTRFQFDEPTTSPRGHGDGSRGPSTGSSTRTTRTACGGLRCG